MKRLKFEDVVAHETDDYFFVNKPPNLSALDERDSTRQTVIGLMREHSDQLQLCHRIDKETSGILAVAKHPEAYRHLAILFEDRAVEKFYHAIVNGVHDFQQTVVDLPLGRNAKGVAMIDPAGKPSTTVVNTLKAYTFHTLVECQPLTGRLHQIRVHLSAIKAPIASDELYGGEPFLVSKIKPKFKLKKWTDEEPLIKRAALHALKLSFEGLKEEPIEAEAPYPKDFGAVVKQLDKNS